MRKGSAELHNGGFTGLKPSQIWYCGKYRVSLQTLSSSQAHCLHAGVAFHYQNLTTWVIASVETAMGIAVRTIDVPACIVRGCWSRRGLRRSIRRWHKLEKSSGALGLLRLPARALCAVINVCLAQSRELQGLDRFRSDASSEGSGLG